MVGITIPGASASDAEGRERGVRNSFRLTPLYWGVIPAPQNTPLPLAVAGLECTSGCEKAPVSRDVRVRYGLMKTACGLRSRRTRTSPARGPGRPPH